MANVIFIFVLYYLKQLMILEAILLLLYILR